MANDLQQEWSRTLVKDATATETVRALCSEYRGQGRELGFSVCGLMESATILDWAAIPSFHFRRLGGLLMVVIL